MNEIFHILSNYLPNEIIFRIFFYFQGLQHPVAKILNETCPHLEKNYSTLLNITQENIKKKSCNCQTQILLKWKYPSPLTEELEMYYQRNKFDNSYPYSPRKKNQETRVRWIFCGYQKKYIFGRVIPYPISQYIKIKK